MTQETETSSASRLKGLVYAIISSASFGMIPLFTMPAINAGMSNESIIFYRFAFSTLLFALLVAKQRPCMKIPRAAALPLVMLTLFYALCSLFLLTSYAYMPTGVATTIHFLYPVFVTVLMVTLFKEKLSLKLAISILLAVAGVALLSLNGVHGDISGKGLAIVLVTVFCYGAYIVGVNKTNVRTMDGMAVTFYVLLLTTVFCAGHLLVIGSPLEAIPDFNVGFNLVMLGLVPTLVSNLCLVLAIRHIGSTTTSVLGCMEPLTAVIFGVLFLGEQLAAMQYAGIAVVLASVIIVLTDKKK